MRCARNFVERTLVATGNHIDVTMGVAPMRLEAYLQSSNPIILDGAMGTELEERGITDRCESCLTSPDAVIEIHRDYVRAGSNAILTNTLTMNRVFIESHNLDIDVAKVNKAGAALAKMAMQENGYVLGNLSSTGQMLEPYGTCSEQSLIDAFREQAGYLGEGGVDGFIVETIFDLREAVCALKACIVMSSGRWGSAKVIAAWGNAEVALTLPIGMMR